MLFFLPQNTFNCSNFDDEQEIKKIKNQKTFFCIYKTIMKLTIEFRFAKY
jgi:hypothetical protein